jgi:hypothetical protein
VGLFGVIVMGGSLTKSICILDPVLTIWCIYCGCIAVNVIEAHVGSIHDVYAPQLGILDVEVLDADIGYIPEDKWHRSAWLGITFLGCVPYIPVAVDAASAMSVNRDVVARDNKSGGMILEGNWVGVVSPVI